MSDAERLHSAPDGAPGLESPPDRIDPEERVDLLLRDLRSARSGLSSREAERRLVQFGPNLLRRRGGRRWPRELARQFTPPFHSLLGTAALDPDTLAFVAPFPFIVWGADEVRRWLLRRRSGASEAPRSV